MWAAASKVCEGRCAKRRATVRHNYSFSGRVIEEIINAGGGGGEEKVEEK